MTEPGTAERIAAAALAILSQEGAAAVTMRRVAEAAGITAMAIYKHYPNRGALLRVVADASFQKLAGGWGLRTSSPALEDRMFGLLEDFLDFALGQPHLYQFLMADRWEQARSFPNDFATDNSSSFNTVVKVVTEAMHAGYLREDDPLEVTLVITANTQGLVQLYLGGRIALTEPDFRALCARSTRRILNGLKA